MTTTTLEAVKRAAQAAVDANTGVEAVLLYGSRARSDAEHDSDWDVAILTREPARLHDLDLTALDRIPDASPLQLSRKELERNHNHALTIYPVLVRQARALAGRWNPDPYRTEHLEVTAEELRQEMKDVSTCIHNGVISYISALEERQAGKNPSAYDPNAVQSSQRAGEQMGKAVLAGFGIPPRKVHDLAALADQLEDDSPPDERARTRPLGNHPKVRWADLIRGMNGAGKVLNQAPYRKKEQLEDHTKTAERLTTAMQLQREWLEWFTHSEPATRTALPDIRNEVRNRAGLISSAPGWDLLPEAMRRDINQWQRWAWGVQEETQATEPSRRNRRRGLDPWD